MVKEASVGLEEPKGLKVTALAVVVLGCKNKALEKGPF